MENEITAQCEIHLKKRTGFQDAIRKMVTTEECEKGKVELKVQSHQPANG